MSQFEDQEAEALRISSEVGRCLVALGVDWTDQRALRVLAREALDYRPEHARPIDPTQPESTAKMKFFGLVALMLRTMEEGASEGRVVHGNDVWKAVSRALWAEKGES